MPDVLWLIPTRLGIPEDLDRDIRRFLLGILFQLPDKLSRK
jgi:hypothetical protein